MKIKLQKFKETYFFKIEEIQAKRNGFGTPVIVLDLKTNISTEHISIAEAARHLNTYPKAIWRKVKNKTLYLNRYHIIVKEDNSKLKKILSNKNLYIFVKRIALIIYNNRVFIINVLFWIIIIIILYIIIMYIIFVCKDIYYQYVLNIREIKINYNEYIYSNRFVRNYLGNNMSKPLISNNTNALVNLNEEIRYKYLINNKWTSINNLSTQLDIYHSVLSKINLDFNVKYDDNFSALNSYYPSPIIEQVNINKIFSNAIMSNRVNDITYNNSLSIQGINYNRNYAIIGDNLVNTKLRTTEILNYQSNILYCIINGISPSTY